MKTRSLLLTVLMVLQLGCNNENDVGNQQINFVNIVSEDSRIYKDDSGNQYAVIKRLNNKNKYFVVPYKKAFGAPSDYYTDHGAYYLMFEPAKKIKFDKSTFNVVGEGTAIDSITGVQISDSTPVKLQPQNAVRLKLKATYSLLQSDVIVSYSKYNKDNEFIEVKKDTKSLNNKCRFGEFVGADGYCWANVDDRDCGKDSHVRFRKNDDKSYSGICLLNEDITNKESMSCSYGHALTGNLEHDGNIISVDWRCSTDIRVNQSILNQQ
jgi:hypothetical protein